MLSFWTFCAICCQFFIICYIYRILIITCIHVQVSNIYRVHKVVRLREFFSGVVCCICRNPGNSTADNWTTPDTQPGENHSANSLLGHCPVHDSTNLIRVRFLMHRLNWSILAHHENKSISFIERPCNACSLCPALQRDVCSSGTRACLVIAVVT